MNSPRGGFPGSPARGEGLGYHPDVCLSLLDQPAETDSNTALALTTTFGRVVDTPLEPQKSIFTGGTLTPSDSIARTPPCKSKHRTPLRRIY